MEAKFESLKVQIGSTKPDDHSIVLEMPYEIRKAIDDGHISLKENADVEYDGTGFSFEPNLVREKLFQTTCDMIYKNTIQNVLSREGAKGITTVILVGGLLESPIVIQTLREKVEKDFPGVKVVVPDSPFKSVLLGAVLYGHNPMIFSSRISRETYGVKSNVDFDETKHDTSKNGVMKKQGCSSARTYLPFM
ncbi:hypothetical protein ACF0H5_017726 [Mactra antiquata]